MSVKGHADCVEFVRDFNVPTLVLGGGGYTLRNVPRCWAYETSVLLDTDIKDALPYNDYFEYFGPDYRMHMPVSNMENLNTPKYLDKVKTDLLQILSEIEIAPSVQIQTGQTNNTTPVGMDIVESEKEAEVGPDERKEGVGKEHQSEMAA